MKIRSEKEKEVLNRISESYFNLLKKIDWKDDVMVVGIKEGLNKFLSNAYISKCKEHFKKMDIIKNKHDFGDYYSENAKKQIDKKEGYSNLVFEHMIPKDRYIQKILIEKAKKGKLKLNDVQARVQKYWWIAVVTKEENNTLKRTYMPADWDENDHLKRYENINLHENFIFD